MAIRNGTERSFRGTEMAGAGVRGKRLKMDKKWTLDGNGSLSPLFPASPTDPDADIFPSDSPRKKKSAPDNEDERGREAAAADCPNSNSPSTAGGDGAWGFEGLIKTIAAKKEFGSLIETYRRDLAEFGSGLKKETAAICEATTRAVRDLPRSLEAGVSVAQESLESFGQAIDDLGGSVARYYRDHLPGQRGTEEEEGGWEAGGGIGEIRRAGSGYPGFGLQSTRTRIFRVRVGRRWV